MKLYDFAVKVKGNLLVVDAKKIPSIGNQLLLHTRKGKALIIVREIKKKEHYDSYLDEKLDIYVCDELVSVIGHRQKILSDESNSSIISVFA